MKTKHLLCCIFLLLSNQISKGQSSQLWGSATIGGAGFGTIITADSSGNNFHAVYSFIDSTGSWPQGHLVMANNGKLYGVTDLGGFNDSCVIFSYDPSTGTYTDIYDEDQFPLSGWGVSSGLTVGSNGILYGLAAVGGMHGSGVIFSIDPATDTYQDIYDFNSGSGPTGGLLQLNNGLLYGLTGSGINDGVIFSFDPSNSNYSELFYLTAATGTQPFFNILMQATNSKLYGMTRNGGANSKGVIFSFDLATNIYTDLHDFDGINGEWPQGSLIQASNGLIYGCAGSGGIYNDGVLFNYDINSNIYTKLFDFDGPNGHGPQRRLTQLSNGKLIGMTTYGGLNNCGVVFTYDIINNTYTDVFDYGVINGCHPDCDIVEIFQTSPTGIKTLNKNNYIDIFPNPAKTKISVSLNQPGTITISNLLGEILLEKKFSSDTKEKEEVDVSFLSDGIYFIKAGNVIKKLVKE